MQRRRLFAISLIGSLFVAGCGGGSGMTSASTQPSIGVGISLTTVSLDGGGSQAFTATVTNDTSNAGVTWSIGTGVGSLGSSSTTGVTYSAPSVVTANSSVTLTASSKTDPTKSASAAIALNAIVETFSTVTTGIRLDSGQALLLTVADANDSSAKGAAFTVSGAGTVNPASAPGNSPATTLTATGITASTVTVTATSIEDPTKSASTAAIVVNQALAISTSAGALTAAKTNTAYPGVTLATSGGTAPLAFALVSGSLPAGLTLNSSTGAIFGTPTGSAGTSTFTVKATDSATTPVSVTSGTYTIAVSAAPLVWVTSGTLATGTVGTAYTQNLASTGGTGAIIYTLNSGTLPAGLSISGSTITGTPTAPTPVAGNVITIKATDSAAPTHATSVSGSLTLIVNPVPLVITSTSLPAGTVNAAYSYQLTSTGGTGAITWSLTAGTLPSGLSLSSSGLLSGTPTATASGVSLTFKAADSAANQAQNITKTLSLTISPVPTITSVTVACTPTSAQTGLTSQCTATVTGTGSYSSTVTWSVGGVAGGNATVGTISSTGLYTAPSAVPATNPVTITATSTKDATKSGSATETVIVLPLAIVSLSTNSPVALTPITVTTSGVNPNAAISLTFSDGSGFSVTESPIRVDTTGSGMMIVAVPLYINSATGVTASGSLSLVLTQGTQSSAPVTVDIQDMPPVASYGATPGQISHAALIFEAMVVGQRINDLQAFQALPGNTVNTTQAQSALIQLLVPILNARSDVDSVISNPSLVIPVGTIRSNGSPVQFDQIALDTMDRVNGIFLSEVLILPTSSPQLGSQATKSVTATQVAAFIAGAQTVTNLFGYEQSMLKTYQANQGFSSYSVSDYASALSKTIGTSLSTVGAVSGNEELGATGAVFSLLPPFATALGSDAAWTQAWISGDTAAMGVAEMAMAKGQNELLAAFGGLVASYVATNPVLAEDVGLKLTSAGASYVDDFIVTAMNIQDEPTGSGFAPINLQSVPISSTTPPSSSAQGIATVLGTIVPPTGGLATPQGSLELCCFNGMSISGIVDADGNFESFIPLAAADTTYQAITLDATDPLTGAVLASETVDLSGLNTTTPITLPTLTIVPATGGSLTGGWGGPMTESGGGCNFSGTMTWNLTQTGSNLSGYYAYSGNLTSGDVNVCGSSTSYADTFIGGSVNGNTITLNGSIGETISATVNGSVITGTMTYAGSGGYPVAWNYTLNKQ